MSKIIFFSNIKGNFNKSNEIIEKIQQKNGKFDIVIFIGNTFTIDQTISSLSPLSNLECSTIINDVSEVGTLLKHKFPKGQLLKDKVYFLGRSGIYQINGFNFAFFSGFENKRYLYEDNYHYTSLFFDRNDIEELVKDHDKLNQRIDFLIINTIPYKIGIDILKNKQGINAERVKKSFSFFVEILISKLNPRYIISSTNENFYYEKVPYINSNQYLTRFIHIANMPNQSEKPQNNEKFIYALVVSPANTMPNSELFNLNVEYTENIYFKQETNIDLLMRNSKKSELYSSKKMKVSEEEIYIGNLDKYLTYEELNDFLSRFGKLEYVNMIYDKNRKKSSFLGYAFAKYQDKSIHGKIINESNNYSLKGKKVIISEKLENEVNLDDITNSCWFCYDNPSIEKNLIIRTFDHFYLAFSKGQICPHHYLIVPKTHIQSYVSLNSEQKQEFNYILNLVIKFIKSDGLDYISYEKNLAFNNVTAKHMNFQIVGINKDFSFRAFDGILEYLNGNSVEFIHFDENQSVENYTKDQNDYYYYIDFPSGLNNRRSRVIIKTNKKNYDFHDIPRNFICLLIGEEEKMNWKKCETNQKEQEKIRDRFIEFNKNN